MNDYQQIFNKPKYKERRKELRRNQTMPEQVLWKYIRGKQLGVKFRRQHSVGDYIVDFLAKEINLVIEIDGDSHFTENAKEYDEMRTDFLRSLDIEVIRFTNDEVMNNVIGVCHVLREIIDKKLLDTLNLVNKINSLTPPSLPLRRGGTGSVE